MLFAKLVPATTKSSSPYETAGIAGALDAAWLQAREGRRQSVALFDVERRHENVERHGLHLEARPRLDQIRCVGTAQSTLCISKAIHLKNQKGIA